ncbi:Flp family type IVb pilin [Asanoa iriomotensis]|uniref:Pilus assembly protein Flp/PilA n=1 Tax=Asanoa iriomotensis TaxID=234613 RepID=A0ABQ4BYR5_9ACTN|nr:hypothetical protein [Asanoa iriomotensis]GIF55316.1 hypothetical protein Air01nite_14110 [Asanoa iriomotensis]
MIEKIKRYAGRRDRDRGATATEYALIMGFIVAAVVIILAVFGPAIANNFDSACRRIVNAPTCLR